MKKLIREIKRKTKTKYRMMIVKKERKEEKRNSVGKI